MNNAPGTISVEYGALKFTDIPAYFHGSIGVFAEKNWCYLVVGVMACEKALYINIYIYVLY